MLIEETSLLLAEESSSNGSTIETFNQTDANDGDEMYDHELNGIIYGLDPNQFDNSFDNEYYDQTEAESIPVEQLDTPYQDSIVT